MKKRNLKTRLFQVFFGLLAVCLVTVDIWSNVSSQMARNAEASIIAITIALGIALAIMTCLLPTCWRFSRVATLVVAIAIGVGTTFSLYATYERVMLTAWQSGEAARQHNAPILAAREKVASLQAEVKAEAGRGGCGRNCRRIMKRLEVAQTDLGKLGAIKDDDITATRLSSLLNVPRELLITVRLMSAPLAVFLFGQLAAFFAGCGARPTTKKAKVTTEATETTTDPKPTHRVKRGPKLNSQVIDFKTAFERKNGRQVTAKELQLEFNLAPRTAYRYAAM